MDKLDLDGLHCVDCNKPNPSMHNSREVRRWGKTQAERFPGYLCVPCWIAANPILFKHGIRTEQPKPVARGPSWALAIFALLLAGLIVFLFSR